jgi:glycosyltransferase involved in cell wall biosynthesis
MFSAIDHLNGCEMSEEMTNVIVYPRYNANYYSYYLLGLLSVFGSKKIKYSTKEFPNFHHHALAFILQDYGELRVYISAGDGPELNEDALKWCNIYAKVNLEPSLIPEVYAHKFIAIGPSFGVRIFEPIMMIREYLLSVWAGRTKEYYSREHLANYWRQYKYRLPIKEYVFNSSKDDYVFFVTSLWKKEFETNQLRASFMDVCKNYKMITFEGGFVSRKDGYSFGKHMISRRYSFSEYLTKTQKSAVSFNTPAVQQCHGWKLGEFLALGKAIISTKLSRSLPYPLIHGEHVHFVDGSFEEINAALSYILDNPSYRKKLEHGARNYYLTYLQPTQVIKRILQFSTKLIDYGNATIEKKE